MDNVLFRAIKAGILKNATCLPPYHLMDVVAEVQMEDVSPLVTPPLQLKKRQHE